MLHVANGSGVSVLTRQKFTVGALSAKASGQLFGLNIGEPLCQSALLETTTARVDDFRQLYSVVFHTLARSSD